MNLGLSAVVVCCLAGCASSAKGDGGEPDPLTATAPIQGSQLPKAPRATKMVNGSSSSPWTLLGISSNGRRLYLNYGTGDDCSASAGVLVEEGPKTVTITATTRVVKNVANCGSNLNSTNGYVDLKDPLGSRKLIHASLQRTG